MNGRADGRPGGPEAPDPHPHPLPPLVGRHHLRLPVGDVWASRDWYSSVLGFDPVFDLEEESGPVGVILRHPSRIVLSCHLDGPRAAALAGFAVLGLQVADRGVLDDWCHHFDAVGQRHGPVSAGPLGWFVDVPDPDGIVVRLHSEPTPDPDEA